MTCFILIMAIYGFRLAGLTSRAALCGRHALAGPTMFFTSKRANGQRAQPNFSSRAISMIQLIERLDPAILDVINDPKKTQKNCLYRNVNITNALNDQDFTLISTPVSDYITRFG